MLGIWGRRGGHQQRLSLPSRAAAFQPVSVCGASSQSHIACEHHQHTRSRAGPPLNPHQSTKVRRKSKAPCSWLSPSQRPGASRGTGCSLRPWPWLLLLLRLAGRRGCLTSVPDLTGAVVRGTDPNPGHHAAAGSVPTPAGLGGGHLPSRWGFVPALGMEASFSLLGQ